MKNKLLVAMITATALSSSFVFAEDITTTPDNEYGHETKSAAIAHIRWAGSIADLIPGDNIAITGEGGITSIPDGDLNLEENGTFSSTDIVLESHQYNNVTFIAETELAPAAWTLVDVSYTWGDNNMKNANVEVFNTTADATTALVKGVQMPGLSSMSLQVRNTGALELKDITDKSATAKVNVTMNAAFVI